MDFERKKTRSIYYWLKDTVFVDSPFIKIVDAYDDDEVTIPSIAIKEGSTNSKPIQLGDRRMYSVRVWYFDIYATNKDQRSDISYRIMRELDNGIPILDFDEGFPPTVAPSQIGVIIPKEKSYTPVDVNPVLVKKMYWRGSLTLLESLTQLS